jgi:hypothetical protein
MRHLVAILRKEASPSRIETKNFTPMASWMKEQYTHSQVVYSGSGL